MNKWAGGNINEEDPCESNVAMIIRDGFKAAS